MNKLTLIAMMTAAACGGGQKTSSGGGGGGNPPPPPAIGKNSDMTEAKPGQQAPKQDISKDARQDYQAAYGFFADTDKGGKWNDSACRQSAEKFQAVVKEHSDLVAAQFMVGLSYTRCSLWDDAAKAFQQTTNMKGDATKQAMALSSLGTIYWKQGKLDSAKQYWDQAIKANGKLVGARIGIASLELEQMRKMGPKDPKWKDVEGDARINLSNALGVDSDNVEAYATYGLLYMEGWKENKNRLLLAKLLLDEGQKRNANHPALQNAYGLYYMHRGALNEALASFTKAVEGDPKFVEARVNAGILTLSFRKYDTAKEMFGKALEVAPKNYDAVIGLGIALRGLNDLDGAEKQFKLAQQINPKDGDAYYNLGVLYKDFRANKQNDPDPIKTMRASQNVYKQAKDFFTQFLDKDGDPNDKNEAKNNIADCDKVVKQLDSAITSLQNAPQQPAAPATPPAAPAAAPAAPPAAPAGK
ncbi:MAG: tetratricopeptide repeat protein [Kofleriaceae bacterium]